MGIKVNSAYTYTLELSSSLSLLWAPSNLKWNNNSVTTHRRCEKKIKEQKSCEKIKENGFVYQEWEQYLNILHRTTYT